MINNEIIILVGFSASGKDTIAKKLANIGYHFIISSTTRPMRNNESQGDPYWFISEKEFIDLLEKGKFIEYRKYNTLVNNTPAVWYYGVLKDEVKQDKANVVVLDILGLRKFKEYFGDRCISFFIDCDTETRRQRCIKRGDYDETEFNRRLEDDIKNFNKDLIKKEINYIIKSTDVEENLNEILTNIKKFKIGVNA